MRGTMLILRTRSWQIEYPTSSKDLDQRTIRVQERDTVKNEEEVEILSLLQVLRTHLIRPPPRNCDHEDAHSLERSSTSQGVERKT